LHFSLYYANVSVGTPPLWFLVALDTGSDLFWLPCNCTRCVPELISRGKVFIFFYPNRLCLIFHDHSWLNGFTFPFSALSLWILNKTSIFFILNHYHHFPSSNWQIIKLNTYNLDKSSTSNTISCTNSSYCTQRQQCPSSGSSCRYRVDYLSNDTSTRGILVEDVLHLITDDDITDAADTRIIFG